MLVELTPPVPGAPWQPRAVERKFASLSPPCGRAPLVALRTRKGPKRTSCLTRGASCAAVSRKASHDPYTGRACRRGEPGRVHRRSMFPTGHSALRAAPDKSTGVRTGLTRTGDGFPVLRTERGTALTDT